MNIHFIADDSVQLAYFGETARFFAINSLTKSLIEDIMMQKNTDVLTTQYPLTHLQLQQFQDKLFAYALPNTPIPTPNTKHLEKLVLNISNTCNLKCKYCYAHHGTYGTTQHLMTKEMAKQILDRFYSYYDDIRILQLFGGEPTLNLPVIKFICDYVTEKNKSLASPTAIGFITNGILITDEVIELINTYNLQVTVSYDGHPLVNDTLRVFPNNQGTSALIIKNIKKLQAQTSQPDAIEVTFSQEHIKQGISILDIMEHIHKEFGNVEVHIAPVSSTCKCSYSLETLNPFIESIDDLFKQENPDDYVYNMVRKSISTLLTKKFEHDFICEAGITTLAVSSEGNVFPCFTFTDTEGLYMGNVTDPELFSSEPFTRVQNKFINFSKSQNAFCQSCFAKRLCNGCLGCHFLETGNPFNLNEAQCNMNRQMAEKLILNIYKLKIAEAL